MKKYFSLLVLTAMIVPQIAFAAWYNPLSWFNSWSFSGKTDTKTEILEKRVQELENKLNASTTPLTKTENIKTSANLTNSNKTNDVIKTVIPPANITAIKPVVSQPTVSKVDINQVNVNLINAFNDLKLQVKSTIDKYRYTSSNGLTGTDYIQASTLIQIAQKIDSSLYDLKSTNPSQKNIDYYSTQYLNLYSSFKNLGLSNTTQASVQPATVNQENSSGCIKAKEDATNTYSIYTQAKATSDQQIAAIYNQSGITREGADQQVAEISRVNNAKLAVLALNANSAQNTMNSLCYNQVPNFIPPTQTNCQIYGNSGTCTTY